MCAAMATSPSTARAPARRPGPPHPSRAGRPPAAIWALALLAFALSLGWSLLAPAYRAPDEPLHVDLALAVAYEPAYPGAFDRRVSAAVAETARLAHLSEDGAPELRNGPLRAEVAPPRTDRPSFAELGLGEPTVHPNQMPQHPPLYYGFAALVIRALPVDAPWDFTVWVLRAADAALVALVPLFAWAAARVLTGDLATSRIAAVLAIAVPQAAHIAGSVNNDNLLTVLGAGLTVLVVRILAGDTGRRTALVVGIVTGLALLVKAFALVLVGWVALAYAVAAIRARRSMHPAWPAVRAGLVAVAVAACVGGWWWIRNLGLYGTVQPDAFGAPDAVAGFQHDWMFWAGWFTSRVVLRFWGQMGWLEVALPWPLVWALFGFMTALVTAGIAAPPDTRRGRRADRLMLLVPLVGMLAAVAVGTAGIYLRTGLPAGVQGRYLYAGLAGLAVVAAVGAARLAGFQRRRVPAPLLVGVLLLHAYAAVRALRVWWGPAGSTVEESLRALVAWAPIPPAAVAAVVAGVVLTAAGGVMFAAADARQPAPGVP